MRHWRVWRPLSGLCHALPVTVPRNPTSDQPWWRRRRGAIDTVIALLVVPAVIAIALFAGGAFSGNGGPDVAAGSNNGAPEVQGPIVPTVTGTAASRPASSPSVGATPSATPAPTTTAPKTGAPSATPPGTTAPPATKVTPTTTPGNAPTKPLPVLTSSAKTPPAPAAKAPAPILGANYVAERGVSGQDVQTWQKQMVERGWSLETDGIFGPQTEQVLKSFQAQKGLTVDGLLGKDSWTAAWNAPIT